MKARPLCVLAFIFIASLPLKTYSQGFRRVRNTQSNLDFFITNKGVLFNNDAVAGLNWPRGTINSYIFGGGLWFAGKKYIPSPPGIIHPWSSAGGIQDSLVSICGNPQTRTLLAGSLRFPFGLSSGLYIRSDNEKIWETTSLPVHKISVKAIVALPSGQELVGGDSGLYIGLDKNSWSSVVAKEAVTAISQDGVAITVMRPNYNINRIYTPNSDFTNWTLRTTFTTKGSLKFISSIASGSIILGSNSSQIFLSQDTGLTWNLIPSPSQSSIVGIALASSDQSMFVATTDQVFRSIDHGQTWISRNSGLSAPQITALKTHGGNTFALGTTSGIFVLPKDSLNNGGWVNESLGIPGAVSVLAMDIDATNALHIVLSDKIIFTQWMINTFQTGWMEVCELGYNPNTGTGWFSPGEGNSFKDGTDINSKYFSYLSTSFDKLTGLPNIRDSSTPKYRWPIWTSAEKANTVKTNFNFGTHISSVSTRDSLASIGAKPVFISQEDIINSYSDFDSTANPEFQSGTGYPLGLNFHESIYSWSFGRYRDLIFIRYEVTNSSKDTLKDCFLAPAFDPDLTQSCSDGYDLNSYFGLTPQDSLDCRNFFPVSSPFHSDPSALNLGRQWTHSQSCATPPGEYGCIGFAFVETPVVVAGEIIANQDSFRLAGYGPYSLYEKNRLGLSSFRQWTIGNDPVTASRYNFVGAVRKDHANNISGDMRVLMSTGPFTLVPGGTVTTTLAIGIARPSTTVLKDNQDSLVKLMAFAHDFFAHPVSESRDPNSITLHHFDGAPTSSVKQSQSSSTFNFTLTPNPANDNIKINYSLEKRSSVKIEIFNLLGQNIMTLSVIEDAATYSQFINLSKQPSGSYFVRLVIDGIANMQNFKLVR